MRETIQQRQHELLVELQRRLPPSHWWIREAFTTERGRPVRQKLLSAEADRFYVFDENVALTFVDVVLELAGRRSGGALIVSCISPGEFPSRQNRLLHLMAKVPAIRVLTVGRPWRSLELPPNMELEDVSGTILERYRVALQDGPWPVVFVSRRYGPSVANQYLGFFSFDGELAAQLGEEIELVVRHCARRLPTVEKLELLHRTTQRVTHELDSYAQRVERAAQLARRRPDLLTTQRCERIIGEAVRKIEQLRAVSRRGLEQLDRAQKKRTNE